VFSRDIRCSGCGHQGKVQAHDTVGVVPDDQIFRLLGKDSSTGLLHFQCPSCAADLTVNPMQMLSGGRAIGRASSRRYVPIVWGLLILGLGLYLAIGVGRWWSIALAAVCLMFGWASLKAGLFASGREIAELTGSAPMSEATKKKFEDRM
jgi:hypothetical protein